MKILTFFALQLKETQELICEKGYKVLKQNERHTTCTFISGKQPNESCTDYISTFSFHTLFVMTIYTKIF